jgi:hypothetical protein
LFDALMLALRSEFMVTTEITSVSGEHRAQVKVTLNDGQEFMAYAQVEVPATVFGPPTAALPALPTGVVQGAGSATLVPPTPLPVSGNPPEVEIVEAPQDQTTGELLLTLNVSAREAPVTAVIVLIDGQPLATLPPGTFENGQVRLPLDASVTTGTHTISVEVYDTGGQVGHDQLATMLRAPAEIASAEAVAVAETPTEVPAASPAPTETGALFAIGTPITPDAPLETAGPAAATTGTATAAIEAATPPPTIAPAERDTPVGGASGGGDGGSTSPALIVIGLIVIVGGLALGGLWWWRTRRAGPPQAPPGSQDLTRITAKFPTQPAPDFSYDAYAEDIPAGRDAEQTDFYGRGEDDERTALYLGDVTRAKLEVIRSTDLDARLNSPYTLETQRTTLGRDASNDIAFTGDRFVSSNHARIIFKDDQWFLEELGALNKTFVNGREVTGQVPLFDGDLVELGPYTRMRFSLEEPDGPSAKPSSPPPPAPLGDGDDEVTRFHLD